MVTLNKGQYLSDVMPMIPTNCILSKRIPGCGATTLEIMTDRNSIIIVPNVPVINSKCQKYEHLLGVYETITVDKIAEYLHGHRPYKIMTTPESFPKVKKACEICGLDIYKDFFLLDDECHQLIKDVDYRADIILPMDDFFGFERKALVSATPIGFSDPRFKIFRTIEIHANYDYQQKILVVHTYSIAKAVKDYLDSHKDNKVCIFFNSVDGIYSIMKQFNLSDDATVYCAPKSRYKLKAEHGFTNAYDIWSSKTMKQYNFFTGRFYTAFDLELSYKPNLLMVTDPFTSPYTMLDVDTDCIQICGRFRNGICSATHIYRTNEEIIAKTREQLEWEISEHEFVYNIMQTYYNSTNYKDHRYAFGEALETLPFRVFLYYPDRTKNWFAIDNAINDKLVESRYKYRGQVKFWYTDCHYFIPTFEDQPFNKNDEQLNIIKAARSTKDRHRKMVQFLSEFEQPYSEYDLDFVNEIRKIDSTIVEAFELLGRKRIEELNYNERKMKEEVILVQRKGNKVVELIKNSFIVGRTYTNEYITKELTRIFDIVHIHPEKPIKGSMIKDYFQVKIWHNSKKRGYTLLSKII